ncbi:MAG: alpha/beta fold hydrolase [Alphaproteobacteria bacterium]|nr:MAG: alpha/beta fold hydrolase [Alphaproteobacteria bacterium]
MLLKAEKTSEQDIARLRFDDMVRMHTGQRYRFGKKAPHTLLGPDNVHTGRPYLLEPDSPKKPKIAVVLVHGFATTPGELRAYADHLREQGKLVLGVRLPGHGTSPLDLEERSHMEWLDAVREGYEICAALADEVTIVGFSTGGALSLILAQEKLPKLTRVASVATPLLVSDSNMRWLPVGMTLRKVLGGVPGLRDLLRFYPYDRDNTAAIYPRVPLNGLNELRRVIGKLPHALPRVSVPVLVMQGLLDHTVKSRSASMIFRMLGSPHKALRWIAGGPHGLIALNFGMTWDILDAFIDGADLTGKTGGVEHNIRVEPSAKKNAALKRIIRKFG